jgi:NADP-dependent 3-hydroxy acid dehydrogenase YdfG
MARNERSLDGKVVAITGGGRGIGEATARALVGAGAKVAIGELDAEAGTRVSKQLGQQAAAFELNVSHRASFAAFLDATEAHLGPLHALVNNAGVMLLGRLVEESDGRARQMLDVNVLGVLNGMKEAMPRLVARGQGHVVNVASSAGKLGAAGGATYCGTKHFVVGVSESARLELRGTGVEVSCVMPAIVQTELASGLRPTRAVKPVVPEDVAAAIVGALRVPRFDVYVPRALGPLGVAVGLLPRAAREALGSAMGADRLLDHVDEAGRSAYERRAALQRTEQANEGADDRLEGQLA